MHSIKRRVSQTYGISSTQVEKKITNIKEYIHSEIKTQYYYSKGSKSVKREMETRLCVMSLFVSCITHGSLWLRKKETVCHITH